MNIYEFSLKITSPFMTPWQADVLFGHLAWTYKEKYGEEKLGKWLESFSVAPPFILSDGYLPNSFPRPMIPPPARIAQTKSEKVKLITEGKRLKKLRTLNEADFTNFINGKPLNFLSVNNGEYKKVVTTRNIVSRESGRSLEEKGLFEEESIYLNNTSNISFYIRVLDKASLSLFTELLNLVSYSGYGKKKNLGFGQFKIKNITLRNDLDEMKDKANAVVWLSHGVPSRNDPVNGWYKLETKYGRVGGKIPTSGYSNKKPITRILPGSVFRTSDIKPYYGRTIKGISPLNPQVIQYAYALAIPCVLPSYLSN